MSTSTDAAARMALLALARAYATYHAGVLDAIVARWSSI